MEITFLSIIKILMSVAVGGIIGVEREYRNKPAGYRTMILICMGSCIYTLASCNAQGLLQTDRIASNIVTGIGFIGAGVIFKNDESITGLNTAATIWLVGALGILIGNAQFLLAIICAAVTIVVLRINYNRR